VRRHQGADHRARMESRRGTRKSCEISHVFCSLSSGRTIPRSACPRTRKQPRTAASSRPLSCASSGTFRGLFVTLLVISSGRSFGVTSRIDGSPMVSLRKPRRSRPGRKFRGSPVENRPSTRPHKFKVTSRMRPCVCSISAASLSTSCSTSSLICRLEPRKKVLAAFSVKGGISFQFPSWKSFGSANFSKMPT